MKSKLLEFRLLARYKTSIWAVENKSMELLGFIKWYPRWRQYCFISYDSMVYAQGCLRDIAEFIKEQMDKRKKNVRSKV